MRAPDETEHLIVVSHQRSGTHLMIDTIINNFVCFAGATDPGPITIDRLSAHMCKSTPTLREVIQRARQGKTVFKSHSHAYIGDYFVGTDDLSTFVQDLFRRSKIIYVHRDGRDVMVSLYYYMRQWDPRIREVSFGEFIRMRNEIDAATCEATFDRPSYWAFHANSWLEQPGVLYVSYEELITNTRGVLEKICDFVDEPLLGRTKSMRRSRGGLGYLREKIRNRFPIDRVTGKRFTSVSFRKGQIGDWVNHFSSADTEYFERSAGTTNRALRELSTPI